MDQAAAAAAATAAAEVTPTQDVDEHKDGAAPESTHSLGAEADDSDRPEKRRRVEVTEGTQESPCPSLARCDESDALEASNRLDVGSVGSGQSSDESPAAIQQVRRLEDTPAAMSDSPAATASAAGSAVTVTKQSLVTPASAAAATVAMMGKRTFPCRICGHVLSSSSNRARHERAKHSPVPTGAAAAPASEPAAPLQQRLPSAPHRTPVCPPVKFAGSKRARVSILTNKLYTHPPPSPPEQYTSPQLDEESDAELQVFLACSSGGTDAAMNIDRLSPQSGRQPVDDEAIPQDAPVEFASPATVHAPGVGASDLTDVEGVCLLLSDEDMQLGCLPFLEWLTVSPLTPVEVLAKRHRVKTLEHLKPIKNNLKFLMALLHEMRLLPDKVDLRVFTRLDVCEALHRTLLERRVGASRLHALSLLLKKVLVFLSTCDSREKRQFLLPSIFESYALVDSLCSDSSYRRKQDQRNRAVLGIQASQQLLRARQETDATGRYPSQSFRVPATWSQASSSSSSSRGSSEDSANEPDSLSPERMPGSAATGSPTIAAAASSNEMSSAELQLLTKRCLEALQELMSGPVDAVVQGQAVLDRWFMALLVTVTLCLGFAPRSQVLAQMQLGSSFVRDESDGRYWIRLLADMTKNKLPVSFTLPSELTPVYDFYLRTVRPRLLRGAAHSKHDYVFFQRNGSARTDFTSCTTLVTQHLLGHAVNPHAFRSAVITLYMDSPGVSQSELANLARIMAHTPATAQAYYYRPCAGQKAVEASDRMRNLLLQ